MQWKPSTDGEILFLELHQGLGSSIEVTGRDGAGLEFLTSEEYFIEMVRLFATLEVFLRCLLTAREFVCMQPESKPLLLGRELSHAVDLPRSLWTNERFCAAAKQAGRIAHEKRRNARIERAATRTSPKTCYMCGIDLVETPAVHNQFTVEHLWPLCFGGETVDANLVPMCKDCNEKRDNLLTWASAPIQAAFVRAGKRPDSLVRISLGLARLIRTAENSGGKLLTLKEAAERGAPMYPDLTLEEAKHYLYVDLFNLTQGVA